MEIVSFEISKKLKEKGFPQEPKNRCQYYEWDGLRKIHPLYTEMVWYESENKTYLYSAPTISQVLKWLREEKKIHICVDIWKKDINDTSFKWGYDIVNLITARVVGCDTNCGNSYELAAIAGIKYCLDNLI